MERFHSVWMAILTLIMAAVPACATFVELWVPKGPFSGDYCENEPDVVRAAGADVIATGTLSGKTGELKRSDHSEVLTRFMLSVDHVLKGAVQDRQVEIVVRGGEAFDEKGERFSHGFVGMNLPFYSNGARVLVYLRRNESVNAFVVSQYWKLEDGKAIEWFIPIVDPLAPGSPLSESRLFELVDRYLQCSTGLAMSSRSDLVVIGDVESKAPNGPGNGEEIVSLRVVDVVKGPPFSRVPIVLHAGNRFDRKIGDRILFFLTIEGLRFELTHGSLGHLIVRGDTAFGVSGGRMVTRAELDQWRQGLQ